MIVVVDCNGGCDNSGVIEECVVVVGGRADFNDEVC